MWLRRFASGRWKAIFVTVLIGVGVSIARPDHLLQRQWDASRLDLEQREWVIANWATIADGARLDGDGGDVHLVVFTDYECPWCRIGDEVLTDTLEQAPHIGIAVRHFPNPWTHGQSLAAAVAAVCAERVGAFPTMHRHLFASSEWRVDGDWLRVASAAGIAELDTFSECIGQREVVEQIGWDGTLGRQMALAGTPSYVFSTGRVATGLSPDEIRLELGL